MSLKHVLISQGNMFFALWAVRKKIIFSYQHGFLYIRQLSIHLRKGLMNVSRETLKSIANWQFVFAVTLWCKMLTVIEELEDLELPLVQAWIFRKFRKITVSKQALCLRD